MDKHWQTKKKFYCKDTQETAIGYPAYLQTKHWKALRTKVAEAHNYTCERCCGVFRDTFNIHHNTYKRIGKENMGDLSFLCDKCHTIVHKAKRDKKDFNRQYHLKISNILATLSERQLEQAIEYLEELKNSPKG